MTTQVSGAREAIMSLDVRGVLGGVQAPKDLIRVPRTSKSIEKPILMG